ncbi:AAA family ATPase [Patescibacteria group bacterium]|nr:AAA family ATPase [Patescibacteria group bacterium]
MKFEETFKNIENVEEKTVQLMGFEIETDTRKHERIPSLNKETLRDFVEDEYSQDLMKKILEAVVTNDPLLLEGDPAVGKNITIEYLAALLNRPMYRVSLNGQSDIGALVGKWIPKNKGLEQQLYDKIKNRSSLSEDSKQIVAKYTQKLELEPAEGQEAVRDFLVEGFSEDDIKKIAENENIEISDEDWTWQDSDIVRAQEEGAWLILDEVNTAEPQILVRLNALLEKGGEMILSENGNRKIKRDPKSRVFGTMNPPGGRIKGRVQLSEDYVSRWRFVSVRSMNETEQLNRLLISEGLEESTKSTVVEVKEKENVTQFTKLSDVYDDVWVRGFMTKYATFFCKVKSMVGKDINTKSGEQQNITYDQRDTVRFKQFILTFRQPGNFKQTVQDALQAIFYDKLKSPEDRQRLKVLAEDIVQLDEPVEKVVSQAREGSREEVLNLYADLLSNPDVPEDHKEILRQNMQ